jgi:DNA-binding GntR family transcriptional regulator
MPSTHPRLALTIPDDLDAVLRDFADSQGKPLSKVVVEILMEMKPQLESITKIARALKAGKTDAAKRAMRHMMGDSLAEAMAATQPDMFKKGKR